MKMTKMKIKRNNVGELAIASWQICCNKSSLRRVDECSESWLLGMVT